MAVGYTSKTVVGTTNQVTIGASETDSAVGRQFNISNDDSTKLIIDLTATGVSGTVTLNLQDSQNGTTWFTRASAVVSSSNTIDLAIERAGDQTKVPLRPICRLVATSAAASGATITSAIRTSRP